MATLREIKRRINSIKNTSKITKAMKMVSASKLRRHQNRLLQTRPYATRIENVITHLSTATEKEQFPLLQVRPRKVVEVLVITADRGLCGAFNANIIKEANRVINELKAVLEKVRPDIITLAGSGEPTLHSGIGQIIASIKETTDTPIALLTNGSLLWKKEVRDRISGVDIIMPTLSTVFEDTFRTIHRPCRELRLPRIITGLKKLRKEYHGLIHLEVVFLAGINDSRKELEGLKKAIEEISPDRIQLNTVVRPPTDPAALRIGMNRLEEIKEFFGERAEIIADAFPKKGSGRYDSRAETITEMAKRRPVTVSDIAGVLNMTSGEIKGILKGLLIKGVIRKREHDGEIFYFVE